MKRLTLAALVLAAGAAVAAPKADIAKAKKWLLPLCGMSCGGRQQRHRHVSKARRATQCLYLPSNLGH